MTNWEIVCALRNISETYASRGEKLLAAKFQRLADSAREKMKNEFNDGRGDT
jgi:hypothetical protein